jgi:hypothetical protein
MMKSSVQRVANGALRRLKPELHSFLVQLLCQNNVAMATGSQDCAPGSADKRTELTQLSQNIVIRIIAAVRHWSVCGRRLVSLSLVEFMVARDCVKIVRLATGERNS